MRDDLLRPPAIVEQDRSRATQVREQVKQITKSLSKANLEVAELLAEVIDNGYHVQWGFMSFEEYLDDTQIDLSDREVRYRVRIVKGARALNITHDQLLQSKISKLKEIFSLDTEQYADDIRRLVSESVELSLDEVKAEVRRSKGENGEEEFTFRNFYVTREVATEVIDPAIEAAKIMGGDTIGEGGEPCEPSDSDAIEKICADFLSGFRETREHYHENDDDGGE
jgi:hypothetical protein